MTIRRPVPATRSPTSAVHRGGRSPVTHSARATPANSSGARDHVLNSRLGCQLVARLVSTIGTTQPIAQITAITRRGVRVAIATTKRPTRPR